MIPSVDTEAYTFFPEYKGTYWIDEKYNINLKHILIMSAGIDWDERTKSLKERDNDIVSLIYSDNWIEYVLNKKIVEPPGLRWNYSGGLNILLGGVIKIPLAYMQTDLQKNSYSVPSKLTTMPGTDIQREQLILREVLL